jgi:hypothetical protein
MGWKKHEWQGRSDWNKGTEAAYSVSLLQVLVGCISTVFALAGEGWSGRDLSPYVLAVQTAL